MAKPAAPSAWRQAVTSNPAATSTSPTALLVGIVFVVGALYLGKILIPLALAILLSFMLAPIVTRLRRWHLGRIPSVLLVVLLVFTALLGVGSIVATQVVDLAANLPRYEWNLRSKIRDLSIAIPSGGIVERTSDMLQDLSEELEEATAPEKTEAAGEREARGGRGPPEPVLVQVRRPAPTPLETLREIGGPLVAPIATAGGGGLRDLHAAPARGSARSGDPTGGRQRRRPDHRGDERCGEADQPLPADAARHQPALRHSRRDRALFHRRAEPDPVGSAGDHFALHPLHRAGDRGAGPDRPVVRGRPGMDVTALDHRAVRRPGVVQQQRPRTLAVRFEHRALPGCGPGRGGVLDRAVGAGGPAAIHPLTVCLVVLGRHVPQLGFDVLLGDEPALAPEVKFYQRLLAHDPEEAAEIADEYLGRGSRETLRLGDHAGPGLRRADRLRGALDRTTIDQIAEAVTRLIDDLAAEYAPEVEDAESAEVAERPPGTLYRSPQRPRRGGGGHARAAAGEAQRRGHHDAAMPCPEGR